MIKVSIKWLTGAKKIAYNFFLILWDKTYLAFKKLQNITMMRFAKPSNKKKSG